jgi:hypothetical protein
MHLGMTNRHNNLQNRLVEAICRHNRHSQIATDRVCSVADRRVRPDILVRDEANKRILIIDVKCTFEITDFEKARREKIQKYSSETLAYEQQGYQVTLDGFIMGSLGCWDPLNDPLLTALNIPTKYSYILKRLLVGDVLEGSKNTYWTHIFGDKYKGLASKRDNKPTQGASTPVTLPTNDCQSAVKPNADPSTMHTSTSANIKPIHVPVCMGGGQSMEGLSGPEPMASCPSHRSPPHHRRRGPRLHSPW